jgi:hypothetical protein
MDPRKFVDFAPADDFLEGFVMLHLLDLCDSWD